MIYLYILVMAGVTYLIRMLPLTLFQRPVENRFWRSFLYYVPYACLTAMTIPAIFTATASPLSALAGLAAAVALGWKGRGLVTVAAGACLAVFLAERLLMLADMAGAFGGM